MVEGHQVVHGIMQTRCSRHVPVFIEPISRRRHQQAGFIPMVHLTFILADHVVELPGTCSKSDGVGNVQMRSDEVDVVAGESLQVAVPAAPAKPRIIHHVKMDLGGWRMQLRLGFSEERASAMEGTMRRAAGRGKERKKSNFRENPRNSCRRPYFTKILTEPEGQRRWRPEGPTPHGGAAQGGPRGHVVWPRPASDAPFGLLIGFDLKTHGEKSKSPETLESRHIAKLRRGSQKSPLLRRDGKLEEIFTAITANASPSTSHVSPSMCDGSLGSFLDATIAKSRQIENTETPNATTPVKSPELDYSSDDLDEDYVELDDDFIEKCNATTDARKIKKLLAEHAVRYKPSPDPKFATSPINIRDKDYDFSLDLSHIAIVEKTPFCGTEKESAVEHLTELSTLSGVFSDDVKMRTYFVAKIFPFSLKDDAKTWYNNLPPGSIKSPTDLRDVFFRKYFPASAQHAALQRIYNFDQEDGEKLPEAWARFCSLIRAQPDHDLEKHDLLDIFYSGLTIESRAYLDSCAGCVFRKRTPEAEELLAKIGRNHDDWSTPEPTPTPIVKKRGMIKLNDEDMREAKKSLKEKGIKPEDVKNLPPIEDICETIPPSSMIEYMKDIVTNKRKIPNEEISTMLANYSFNGKIPKKLGDPGAVIDCNKGMVTFNVDDKEHTVYFPKKIDKKGKMKKFKFGELFKKATTSTGRPSRASTQIRRSYNEDVIAPSFAPEEDHGAPNASSFPCYEFLTNAGILDDFFTLVNRAGLATYVGDERGQYYRLTKVFVESFKFHNTEYEPTVAFKIYDIPVTMKLEEFCCALGIAPVGTARRIDDNPRDLLELYRGITGDDCRTIQRGKIRNIQLPAIKYFAYYIGTSILGRENTSNISSYHLAFLNVALTGETPYHLGSLIARRLSSRGPIFGGTIALRILTHLDIPLDSNDVPLTPRKLDIAAMKSHRFVTTDSTIDNMVYRMLFADGNEKEIPLPQQGLFNIDRQSWSLTKEVVEEHMKIQEFHQQHDSENAEPSYDYTVTYPDVSSSTYMEPGRSSSYYEDTTSWGPWE
ncbi:hypothetical protein QYE76_011134 [Lolium multiflorum]|uniref:Retrotransposon gag domain-containing protein n=1 Tax=Lolium multiflorum TaxID=4521 RepID=A0AAD8TYL4_LOLMU|nr:hypothetical protein QYE76_011134 [Lolium multiflorum]